jgi:large conductance mechanosensitive channel
MTGFKNFVLRGNLVELAVAFIMGLAFASVVTATVTVVMDLIGKVGGTPDYSSYAPGGVHVGAWITAVISFLVLSAVVYFLIVKPYTAAKTKYFPEESPGEPADIALLEKLLNSDDLGMSSAPDALIGAYLMLKGPSGMPLVEDRILKNPSADHALIYSAVMALRFVRDETAAGNNDVFLREPHVVKHARVRSFESPLLRDTTLRVYAAHVDVARAQAGGFVAVAVGFAGDWVELRMRGERLAFPGSAEIRLGARFQRVGIDLVRKAVFLRCVELSAQDHRRCVGRGASIRVRDVADAGIVGVGISVVPV